MAKNDDLLEQAAERFKVASQYDQDEREQADDDIRFATNDDGCQWPPELRQEREDDARPCLVLNKIPEKIDQVDGEFKQMRPSFKFRAVDGRGDPKTAEIIAGLMRHIEYNSDARNAYNTTHVSTLHCGRGAWRIDITDAEDDPFVRDIVINRIPNVLTVYWDPFAKKADKSDANYFFVTEIVDKKEFELEHKDLAEQWPDDGVWDMWRTSEGYRVAEYWYKETEQVTFYRVARVENGVPSEVTVTELGPYDQVIEERKAKRPVVKWCKLAAKKIIEGPHRWPTADIPIIVELGKEVNIRGIGKTRGMVRHAKEPQRLYNYWSSQATEQIALAPKAPYLVTAPMVAQYQKLWNTAHKKNWPYLVFDPDDRLPGGVPRREPPPQLSSAYQYEFMRLEHDIMAAMGIYAASLGDEGQEKSGKAILARQRQGSIGSYPYTDSFHTAYIYSSKQIIRLLPHVYDTERIVRIVGEDGNDDMVPINARPSIPQAQQLSEKFVSPPKPGITPYLNDLTVGKYDVAVTIGPSYTTQREETLTIMMDLIKTAPAAANVILDLVVANMDLPHSQELKSRLRKLVPVGIREPEPDEQLPEPQQDPKIMLEMAKLELQKVDLQRKEFEAQVTAIKNLAEAESKEVGAQLQVMTALMTEIRAKIDQDHGMETRNRELDMQEQQINPTSGTNTGQESA